MSWPMVAVGEIAEVKGGGTPSKSRPDFYQGEIPWVTPKDMKFWQINTSIDRITEEAVASSATNLVPENSVLLVNRSGILKHTLPVGVAERPVAINQDIKALIFSDRCDPQYAAHIIKASERIVLGWVRATTADNFPIQNLKDMLIPLPPLAEQRRIAGILDAADALRRRRSKALALLDTLPGAIFAEMFGDGEGLEKAPMKELIEVRSSLADPTLPANADLPHVGPEHILQGGRRIEWGRVQSCHEDGVTSGKYHFSAGDVIYSKIRPYLNKVAIADRSGMCSADMYALRPSSDRMTIRYLHFILGSAEFLVYGNRVSGRANIPKMNRKQLLAFDVPLPTADQQKEFERRLDVIDIERSKHVRQSSELETLFASLQSRAFAGAL